MGQLVPWLRTLQLRLFVNDFDPSPTDDASVFVEPSYAGYAPLALNAWPQPFLNALDQGETDHPTLTFVVGAVAAGDQAYGYWITDPARTFLLGERFAFAPVPMSSPGAMCPVTVRLLSGRLC